MKRLRALLMVCVMCLVSVCLYGSAAAVTTEPLVSGDYQYAFRDDGTVIITRYIGSAGDVAIPSELKGTPVTAIGPNAFDNCSTLFFAEIPEGITSIGDYAFRFCKSLEEINLPDSLQELGKNPFIGCEALEIIEISPDHPVVYKDDHVLFSRLKCRTEQPSLAPTRSISARTSRS